MPGAKAEVLNCSVPSLQTELEPDHPAEQSHAPALTGTMRGGIGLMVL